MIGENAYPRVAGVLYFFTVFDLTGNLILVAASDLQTMRIDDISHLLRDKNRR